MKPEYIDEIKKEAIERIIEMYYGNLNPQEKAEKFSLLWQVFSIIIDNKEIFFGNRTSDNFSFNGSRKISFEDYMRINSIFEKLQYTNIIEGLIERGYSDEEIENYIVNVNLPGDKDALKEIIAERVNDGRDYFKNRTIPENAFVLFIDSFRPEILKNGLSREVIVYLVMGIDLLCKKDIYGYYICQEVGKQDDFRNIFKDLVERGLKNVVLIVSDDIPYIKEEMRNFFSKAEHQLCFSHLQIKIKNIMKNEDQKVFISELNKIIKSASFENGIVAFSNLLERYRDKYPSFIDDIKPKIENYLCFLKYSEKLRRHIFTTKPVEDVIGLISNKISCFGKNLDLNSLDINIFVQIEGLRLKKWRRPDRAFLLNRDEILHIFNVFLMNG